MPIICTAGSIDYQNVHQGIFKYHGLYGSLHTIVRTDKKQIETWGWPATIFEYDIQWTSDSTYYLLIPRVVKGFDSLLTVSASDTLYNEITEINPSWHTVVTSVNGCDPKIEMHYFNVDTIHQYRDLSQLDKYKDYSGSFSCATFVGYNYAVLGKQHSVDTNDYVFSFLEAVMINEKSKFKIIDDVYFTLDSNQKIATCNCRFNDYYDKEIVAIYSSANKDKEAQIIKAWRFNKARLKIEEIPVQHVKYKESDKYVPIWNKNMIDDLIEKVEEE